MGNSSYPSVYSVPLKNLCLKGQIAPPPAPLPQHESGHPYPFTWTRKAKWHDEVLNWDSALMSVRQNQSQKCFVDPQGETGLSFESCVIHFCPVFDMMEQRGVMGFALFLVKEPPCQTTISGRNVHRRGKVLKFDSGYVSSRLRLPSSLCVTTAVRDTRRNETFTWIKRQISLSLIFDGNIWKNVRTQLNNM